MTRSVDPKPLPLIEASPAAPPGEIESIAGYSFEPAFRIAYQGRLRIDARGWESKAKSFYAHGVARTPKMLWLHVQRIHLLLEMEDPDIHGALIDLFLILDGKGIALCKRMLSLASSLLTPDAQRQLLTHLQQGGWRGDPHSSSSVLSSGQLEHTPLIQMEVSRQEAQGDPLQIASEQLVYGQTDLAQKTLEEALLTDTHRLELHHALLEIYRHSRAREQLVNFLQRIDGLFNPEQTAWQELLNELEQDHDQSG